MVAPDAGSMKPGTGWHSVDLPSTARGRVARQSAVGFSIRKVMPSIPGGTYAR
jgi:hypothetical protein